MAPFLLLLFISAASLPPLFSCDSVPIHDISLENPVLQLTSSVVVRSSSSVKDKISSSCERVRFVGLSRLQLTSYANSIHVLVNASDEMFARHHSKVEFCIHRNTSAGLCQCEIEDWKNLKMGQLFVVMSPYETKLIDIKRNDGISGSLTISIEEERHRWRLFCLGVGFLLLLLAPIVSNWVPFYYSSSMALGVLLVILLLLFQGMKLLPTGRKNILYLTLYGSALGLGSLLAHYFSVFVNSVLVSFGFSEEMHNPVSVFLLLFIILSGAAIGFWMVRKFVLSEDGGVDAGIAQFVKWAMRVIAMMFIFQSSHDTLLATTALVLCWNVNSLVSSNWRGIMMLHRSSPTKEITWQGTARRISTSHRNAEFLSPPRKSGSRRTDSGSRFTAQHWSSSPASSPVKGLVLSHPRRVSPAVAEQQNYYSTFHETPTRKFSKKEWESFTQESTKNALTQWASSPQVAEWLAENAHRIHLTPKDDGSDEDSESSSGSSEEVVEDNPGFFGWL